MAPHSEYRTPRGRRPGPALTNTRAPLLYRILRALASRGIFAEVEDRRFAVTPLADPLRSASEGSVRAYAIFASQAFAQRPWEQMLETPRTGQPGFDQVYGAPLFEYLATDARAGEIFNEAMTSNSSREAEAVVAAYDFMGLQSIVVRSATTCGSPHRRAKNAVTPLGGSRSRYAPLPLRAGPGATVPRPGPPRSGCWMHEGRRTIGRDVGQRTLSLLVAVAAHAAPLTSVYLGRSRSGPRSMASSVRSETVHSIGKDPICLSLSVPPPPRRAFSRPGC
jgi:hypothetical protein